ncbi:hypothetical protein MUNTM_01020 [Mycobacterium sp. MUNTM1]
MTAVGVSAGADTEPPGQTYLAVIFLIGIYFYHAAVVAVTPDMRNAAGHDRVGGVSGG